MQKTEPNPSAFLSAMAVQYPEKPAILHPVRTTYRAFNGLVNRYACGLERSGMGENTRTIMLVPAGIEFFALTFALLRIGAVPVFIDPGMGARAMVDALAGVEAEAFIGIARAQLLRKIYPKQFGTVKTSVTVGKRCFLSDYCLPDLLHGESREIEPVRKKTDAPAALFFTSGSTGAPKGVVYHAFMMNAQVQLLKSHFGYGHREIELVTFPLLGLFALCMGLSIVLADMDMSRPALLNPRKLVQNISDYHCTQMFCSPMVLTRLVVYARTCEVVLPSLRRIFTAGAPAPPALLQSFQKLLSPGAEVFTPYGATEALPVTDIRTSELLKLYAETDKQNGVCVGYPLDGTAVRIIKINENPIPRWSETQQNRIGEVGEIVVRGAVVSPAYWNNAQANELSKILEPDTGTVFHRLGDLGFMDDDGRLWYVGRKAHRVVTEKGTLFTIPCEAVFNKHPRVRRCALVGVPIKGSKFEQPVLCVQLKPHDRGRNKKKLIGELSELGRSFSMTRDIKVFLFPRRFPVDPRHNAKICREKLALWAVRRIS